MRQIAAIPRGDKSPRLHCCCDKSLALSLSLRYVAQIQTSLNLCDRSQRQNSVAATMIFTCHTRQFVSNEAICQQPVAATCRSDLSHRVSRPSHITPCVKAESQVAATGCNLSATCRGNVSQRFVTSCVSAESHRTVAHRDKTLPQIQNTSTNHKTLPQIQNTSTNYKTLPQIQNTSKNTKHFNTYKTLSQIQNTSTNTKHFHKLQNTPTNYKTLPQIQNTSTNTKHFHKLQNTPTNYKTLPQIQNTC